MTNIDVNLKQEHIDRGVANDAALNPASLAIQDALPGVKGGVEARKMSTWLFRSRLDLPRGVPLDTPASVRNFIRDFDAGRDVEPFTFELEVPEWAVRR